MSEKPFILDVRDDIRNGQEPFSRIMSTVAQLPVDASLLLIAPFQPVPLFPVMARKGFAHSLRQNASGDWEVLFTRQNSPEPPETQSSPCTCCGSGSEAQATEILEVDARGLEPPQPLVTILEAVTTLLVGAELRARTDRRPLHLYAQLEERGFTGTTEAEQDGSYITHIRRA
jgi:uncharacterized protein (DUF2249 family)